MAHLALYRKYRPQGFDSLIGQDAIKKTLIKALEQKKVSHAYLFAGPRGTGKTSSAKLLAKALNCSQPNGVEPCGKCEGCKDSNPDIIEIDAASNNGVDEIREIRDKVQYTPVYGKYKVYIIDEVHMLTTAAFNALLKTLEEPPAHAIFILATTEPHKIPLTILSRCQRYDFRRISQQDIVSRMKYILSQEGQEVEEEALQLIAQIASGGMRDALSLLDQCLSHATGKVTLSDVIELTGAVDSREIGKMIELIDKGDTEATLQHFNQCFENGKEAKFFIEEMLIYYRDILLYQKLGEKASLKKAVMDPNFERIASIDESKVYPLMDILSDAQSKLKYQQDSQLVVEMALIKMTHTQSDPLRKEVEYLKQEVELLKQQLSGAIQIATTTMSADENIPTVIEEAKSLDKTAEKKNENELVSQEEPVITLELDDILSNDQQVLPPAKEPSEHSEENEKWSTDDYGEPYCESCNKKEIDTETQVSELLSVGQQTQVEEKEEQSNETFLDFVQNEMENGSDWIEVIDAQASQAPVVDLEDLIRSNSNGDLDSLATTIPLENDNDVRELSERENEVLSYLSDATKELRLEYKQKSVEILNVLKESKLSTYSLFREFTIRAVSTKFLIVSHADKLKVKLLEKVTNRSIVQAAIEEVYKPLKVIAVTDDEWRAIREVIKSQSN